MSDNNRADDEPTTNDVDIITDLKDLTEQSPFLDLFGTEAKARILHVLLATPEPLNPSRIVDRAGLGDRHSWYDNKDDLLATGLVVQTGNAGNSPLYALAEDDPRIEALEKLHDFTAAALRDTD